MLFFPLRRARSCIEEQERLARRYAQQLHGDVIGAAASQRHLDQFLASLCRRVRLCDVGEILVGHLAPKTIGAEQEQVTLFEGNGVLGNMRRDLGSRSQCGGKDVALGMRLGVFGTDNSAFDEPADVRMIARETRDSAAANQVKPAVAHVGEIELAVNNRKRGAGRAHAVKFRMFEGVALNRVMCAAESGDQDLLRVAVEIAIVDITNGLDRQAAGFLAAFVSPHAIGHGGEAALALEIGIRIRLPVNVGVLIIRALQATSVRQAASIPGLGCLQSTGIVRCEPSNENLENQG